MAGFDLGSLAGPLAGGLLSMFGGGGGLNRDQRQLLNTQKNVANNLYQYGTGVPGADPGERAALAQQQAMLGEQQLQQQQNAYGALNRNQGVGNLADFLQNMASNQTAQRMSLDSSHLMNALAQRKQALLAAANVSQGAAGLASQQGGQNPLPALFGQLGQALAYHQAYGKRPGAAGPNNGNGTPGMVNANPGQHLGNTETAGVAFPGLEGAGAPGNEPGGTNTVANQFRQGMGLSLPPAWNNTGSAWNQPAQPQLNMMNMTQMPGFTTNYGVRLGR